jgi:hypothetical protein
VAELKNHSIEDRLEAYATLKSIFSAGRSNASNLAGSGTLTFCCRYMLPVAINAMTNVSIFYFPLVVLQQSAQQ